MRFGHGVGERLPHVGSCHVLMVAVVAGVLGLELPPGGRLAGGTVTDGSAERVVGDGQLGREGGHQQEILGLVNVGVGGEKVGRSVGRSLNKFP